MKDEANEIFPGSENRKTRQAYRELMAKKKGENATGGTLMPRQRAHRNKKAYNRKAFKCQAA